MADSCYREMGFRLAELAAEAVGTAPRAESLLHFFVSLCDADAVLITLRDDESDELRVWAIHNYCRQIVDYVTQRDTLDHDLAYQSILQNPARSPMRAWEDPDYAGCSYRYTPIAQQQLLPSGFHGGMSARLTTADGHHIGNFHMNTRGSFNPDPTQVNTFVRSFRVLATLLRPTTGIACTRESITIDDNSHECAGHETGRYQLTRRESEVLSKLALGLTNKAMGASLRISERTVAHHVEQIMGKLAVPTRTAAVAFAIREGLVHP